MGEAARLLVNIDVPDLAMGEAFYRAAFGCDVGRRFGGAETELIGLDAPIYLICRPPGERSEIYGSVTRDYRRHWTPVHLDVAVDDLDAAVDRALSAGAVAEGPRRSAAYGRIATFADPFGHGFCLIEFNEEGYDAV